MTAAMPPPDLLLDAPSSPAPTKFLARAPHDAASAPASSGPALRFALTFAIYAIPLLVALRPVGTPVYDPDVWWHLRVGQWVVEHRAVPTTDPFSEHGKDRAWIAYSWLYEVLLYELYGAFGLSGVVLYRALLSLAITAAVHRLILRRGPPDVLGAGLTAACLLPIAMLFGERPWLFTILFGTWTLHAVLDLREGRRSPRPWLLPLVFATWANVHIQFVYGLALLLLACVAPVIDHFRKAGVESTATPLGSRRWWCTVLLSLTCLAATSINAYHWNLYRVVAEYASQPAAFRFVNELKAPEFREVCDWMALGLTLAATYALGYRQRASSFELLLLAGTAVLWLHARRDIWLPAVAAGSVLSAGPLAVAAGTPVRRWTLRARAALGGTLALLAVGLCIVRDLSPSRLELAAASVFPVDAARHVAERGYTGPLYNDFNWGGYFIWSLRNLPVAIDGRTNLQGDDRLVRFGAVWAGGPSWHDDPDLAAAGLVIADPQTPLSSLLARDERFDLVYEDAVARVFVARRQSSH